MSVGSLGLSGVSDRSRESVDVSGGVYTVQSGLCTVLTRAAYPVGL